MEQVSVRGKKVFVGLSGGVDSAVSAALLRQAGARVTGVFIKGWYPPGMPCTWAADRRDAMRVAARLHIPFVTLDASKEYKKAVIDYLLAEYRAGRTPNPDVMCNREVKFGVFYRYAMAQGADLIATGHYRTGAKDQSYFLWAVSKEALAKTIFPLIGREKKDVRTLAKRLTLPVAEKKDSHGICFLGSISVDEFLRDEFGISPGQAVDTSGRSIGKHDGVLLYTLGERIALRDTQESGPWFVLAKDVAKNILTVGHDATPLSSDAHTIIPFTDANWIGDPSQVTHAQYRYRGQLLSGKVDGDRFVSDTPVLDTLASGQSLAFFQNDKLMGGGIMNL